MRAVQTLTEVYLKLNTMLFLPVNTSVSYDCRGVLELLCYRCCYGILTGACGRI